MTWCHKVSGIYMMGSPRRFFWPLIPRSQLLLQSIFLRTSGANKSFCSMAAHPRELVFLPLRFQRGNPWISCDGPLQHQREFLTSVRVCSHSCYDVCFQRLGGLKDSTGRWDISQGWLLFVFWFQASPSFPFLRLALSAPKPVLTMPVQNICSPSSRLALRLYVSISPTFQNF